jgi:hypothetical protein
VKTLKYSLMLFRIKKFAYKSHSATGCPLIYPNRPREKLIIQGWNHALGGRGRIWTCFWWWKTNVNENTSLTVLKVKAMFEWENHDIEVSLYLGLVVLVELDLCGSQGYSNGHHWWDRCDQSSLIGLKIIPNVLN